MMYIIIAANIALLLLAVAGLYFCAKARASATAFLLSGGCLGFILLQLIWFTAIPSLDLKVWQELSRVSVWVCFLIATLRFGRGLSKIRQFTEPHRDSSSKV